MAKGANRRASDPSSIPQLAGRRRVRSWARDHAPANDNAAHGLRRFTAAFGSGPARWAITAGIALILAALLIYRSLTGG